MTAATLGVCAIAAGIFSVTSSTLIITGKVITAVAITTVIAIQILFKKIQEKKESNTEKVDNNVNNNDNVKKQIKVAVLYNCESDSKSTHVYKPMQEILTKRFPTVEFIKLDNYEELNDKFKFTLCLVHNASRLYEVLNKEFMQKNQIILHSKSSAFYGFFEGVNYHKEFREIQFCFKDLSFYKESHKEINERQLVALGKEIDQPLYPKE